MLDNIIKPGQRVDLKAVKRTKLNEEEQKAKVYSSKTFDVISDDTVELLMPMEQTNQFIHLNTTMNEQFIFAAYICILFIFSFRYKS